MKKNYNIPEGVTFPQFRSIKIVGALEITDLQVSGKHGMDVVWEVHTKEYPGKPIIVDNDFYHKRQPEVGMMLVLYSNDYLSVCPKDVFDRENISLNDKSSEICPECGELDGRHYEGCTEN